jgi:hypothetical protein
MGANDLKKDDAFARLTLQDLIFPEEDRALYTTEPWAGGFRWFRSPNVVCLEQYRRQRQQRAVPGDSKTF